MADPNDWKEHAAAAYRLQRAETVKKVASAVKTEERAQERRRAAEQELRDLDAGARVFGFAGGENPAPGPDHAKTTGAATSPDGQSAREIVIAALESVYPKPLKAKELRAIIEAKLGRTVHFKTAGMTLYRLANEKHVRRDGTNWYVVPDPFLAYAEEASSAGSEEMDDDYFDNLEPPERGYEPPGGDFEREQFEEDRAMDAR